MQGKGEVDPSHIFSLLIQSDLFRALSLYSRDWQVLRPRPRLLKELLFQIRGGVRLRCL